MKTLYSSEETLVVDEQRCQTSNIGYPARQWSVERVSADHRSLGATTMDLSHNLGRQFALLGGRQHLALVDLADPKNIVEKWTRTAKSSKYEVSNVKWSCGPYGDCKTAAVTWGEVLDILDPFSQGQSDVPTLARFQAHSRTITDCDFSPLQPLLASTSLDKSICLWDLRTLTKIGMGNQEIRCIPVCRLESVVHPSQVSQKSAKAAMAENNRGPF